VNFSLQTQQETEQEKNYVQFYILKLETYEPSQGVHVALFLWPSGCMYTWTVPNFLRSCYYVPPGTSHVCGVDSTRSFQIGPLLWSWV
jgi:hypothetical protein